MFFSTDVFAPTGPVRQDGLPSKRPDPAVTLGSSVLAVPDGGRVWVETHQVPQHASTE